MRWPSSGKRWGSIRTRLRLRTILASVRRPVWARAADHFRAAVGTDLRFVDAGRDLEYTLRLLGR
jgi:hypothetical protein